jgi:hypothetical protein
MLFKGLKAPLSATKGGGLATEQGADQTRKVLMLALDFCPSENPFNDDVGIEYPVFDINDPSLQSRTAIRIQEVFRRFEQEDRARLIDFSFTSENEVLAVDIEYYDMQTDRPESLRHELTSGGS